MHHARTAAAALLAAALLTACTATTSSTPAADASAAASPAAPVAADLDAEQVSQQIATAIPSVKTTVVYTEATDPNKRMGRPHQYVSKTAFTDSRIDKTAAKKDANGRADAISYGGTVETFETAADAKLWADSIEKAMAGMGAWLTPDYIYQSGRFVIRASNLMTPSQAKEYKAALDAIA